MYTEQQPQPSLLEQTAQQAAAHAARKLAKQALAKVAAILGAKVGAIIAVVLTVIALIILLIVLIVSVAGAAFQFSTTVWPVPIATDTAGLYTASGWTISSRFGWRDSPSGRAAEFHDGIDLANPQGACPFGHHCGAPAMFDGQVQYVGWDMAASGDPAKTGGGELVILRNGEDDHETLYAHLEPYRLYVRLEGKIKDSYDRAEYRRYQDYRPIGQGDLMPDLRNSGIAMTCLNDMPNFLPTRTGGGSVVFLYDRPANCTTTVIWGERGGKWTGWLPDQPPASDDARQAELAWATTIDPGRQAKDVALRFRAHLVPPDPPPSPTAVPSLVQPLGVALLGSVARRSGQGSLAQPDSGGMSVSITPSATPRDGMPRSCAALSAGWVRCTWSFADIPTEQERFAQHPDAWLSAARANAPQQGDQPNVEDGDGAIMPPAQLLPTMSNTAVPTSTPAPAHNQGQHVSAYSVGSMGHESHTSQATPDGAVSQATISPMDRQWLMPGDSATWTIQMANNQRGSWSILVGASEPRLMVRAGAACSPIGTNGWLCVLPGAATTLTVTVYAGTDADGLTADIPIAVTDAERGSGPVVGDLRLRIGVGTPPTATPTPSGSPTPVILPPPPPMPTSDGGGGGGGDGDGGGENGLPDRAPQPLVRLPNVIAPQPRLIAPAAASFAVVRQEIVERTGMDAFMVLGDVLRAPSFSTNKPGVLQTSWHKAGRAVDLNSGGPFVRVPEGRVFRLYINNVDITALFEAHGWNRIPVQGETLEWWHYEWHPDGIAWSSAMLQVWDLPTLRAAFPEIDWASIGCMGGSNSSTDPVLNPQWLSQMCVLAAPRFNSTVEYIDGCGPPVRAGDRMYQLDTTLGFVGLTGSTTGPHLHLGLKVKSYDGSWPVVDICTPAYLDGRTAPSDANCYTDMADPLAFLPRAPGGVVNSDDPTQRPAPQPNMASGTTPTPIIAEGAPYQLPPPNYPDSLVFTPIPGATPVGQYWSPYADGGVGEWFCAVWSGWPWCS